MTVIHLVHLFEMPIQRFTNDLLPRRADAVSHTNGIDRAIKALQDGLL